MRAEPTIGHLLRRVQQAQAQALDFQQSYDVTAPQMSVLGAVVSKPGLDQRTVSAITFVDKSTVADVINRLVDRGLVRATRSPADGRRDSLTATRAGVEIVYKATPELLVGNDAVLAAVPAPARGAFIGQLRTLGYAGRTEPPSEYIVPSPDGVRPPLDVPWGLGRLLRACIQRYNRLWAERIPVITPVQWLALDALTRGGDVDQRTLGEMISLDKASLTEMLVRLSRRELVVKSPDVVDRRRRILQLTPAGRELVRDTAPAVAELDREFVAPLPEDQRDGFVADLRRLALASDPRRPAGRSAADGMRTAG